MVGEDTVMMSAQEVRRIHVIRQGVDKTDHAGHGRSVVGVDGSSGPTPAAASEAGGRPGAGPSEPGQAVEPADFRDEEDEGLEAVRHAV